MVRRARTLSHPLRHVLLAAAGPETPRRPPAGWPVRRL